MSAQSALVPFVKVGNRRGLMFQQLCEDDELRAFVERFPASFEPDELLCIMLFIEPDL